MFLGDNHPSAHSNDFFLGLRLYPIFPENDYFGSDGGAHRFTGATRISSCFKRFIIKTAIELDDRIGRRSRMTKLLVGFLLLGSWNSFCSGGRSIRNGESPQHSLPNETLIKSFTEKKKELTTINFYRGFWNKTIKPYPTPSASPHPQTHIKTRMHTAFDSNSVTSSQRN